MKIVRKISLFAMAIFLVGCNEKISPKLLESSVTTPGDGPTIIPSDYYFKVTNTSATLLNYKLHKTGNGNSDLTRKSSLCQVTSSSALNSDTFRASPTANDISCYLEAEELSLYFGGFSLKMEASPNTCDYIAYSPFSYYNMRPGTSTGTYLQITQGSEDTSTAHLTAQAAVQGVNITDGASVEASWDQMLSESPLLAATRVAFTTPEDDQELCRFDYSSSGGPNCDEGVVTIRNLIVTHNTDIVPATTTSKIVNRTVRCGGRAYNCIEGAIREHWEEAVGPRLTLLTQAPYDQTVSAEFKYPSLFPARSGTFPYANYRRDLANSEIIYGTTDPTSLTYTNAFTVEPYNKIFDPAVMERYGRNQNYDKSTAINTTMYNRNATESNRYSAAPLAAEPYLGMGQAYFTSPFYTFYCLDTAYDIKARVRLVVREWDRVFPADATMEKLTDIGAGARQDVLITDLENPDSEDDINYFNDKLDWDNIMVMERVPAPLVFRPDVVDVVNYPDGYFNPSIFPNEVDIR